MSYDMHYGLTGGIYDDSSPSANGVIDVLFSNEGTVEPVALEDVKVALEIDDTYHDGYLSDLISMARQYAEKYLNRSLISRTVQAVLMNGSGGQLLPYGPPSGTITITDADGNVLDATITGTGNFRYVDSPIQSPITVNYAVAGYTTVTLPKTIKIGIIQAVVFWFENRGDIEVNISRVAREMQTTLPSVARETMKYERIKNNFLFW